MTSGMGFFATTVKDVQLLPVVVKNSVLDVVVFVYPPLKPFVCFRFDISERT